MVTHRLWLAVAAWTCVAVVVALILRSADDLPLSLALAGSLVWYYSLGGLVWIACELDARFRLWARPAAQGMLAHAALGVAALGIWLALAVTIARLAVGPGYWNIVFGWWGFQLLSNAMIYAAGVGIGLAFRNADRERRRQQREMQLEVLAREAELTAIKAQLQPHFLFNSLNSILALIDHDPPEARRMLTRLSALLHSVFDRLDETLVPLDRELDTIRDYLDIESIRFGDRMTFSIEAGPDARQSQVPPFLLQPIVENAVKHGIEPHARPGAVRVTGRLDGGRLRVSVVDTGPGGKGADPSAHAGRGLALTRRRLETVYGRHAATIRTERSPEGFMVTLDLPVAGDART